MATTTLSASITNLDASPIVANTTGSGASAWVRRIFDYATLPAKTGGTNIVKFCRIPYNAKVKHVLFESAAQTKGSWQIGLYWSDSTTDGTNVANQGSVISVSFFAGATSTASAVAITDETNSAGHYAASKRHTGIASAAGCTTLLGGFVDICLSKSPSTTTVLTATAAIEVTYEI